MQIGGLTVQIEELTVQIDRAGCPRTWGRITLDLVLDTVERHQKQRPPDR